LHWLRDRRVKPHFSWISTPLFGLQPNQYGRKQLLNL
jgi:hypothetical protein